MDRSTRIANILEQRKPLALKIEKIDENLKALWARLQSFDKHRNLLVTQVEQPTVIGRLREIDFTQIQLNIASEIEALTKLKNRFSRDTINIGVIGRARQGKSRLLQSLTGLSAVEIPDGDRQHCTGVRSTIRHHPDVSTYGEVWFHTTYSFLDEVIAPYFEKLRLGVKPITLEEFAQKPLPPLPQDISGYAEPGAMYEHLKRYHIHFNQYCHLFRDSPITIQRHQLREYVAQDTSDGQRTVFNYLAVKEVKITCSFPNTDVGKIALIDMPGLGDTGLGDEERLIKALGKDIDFVLFVRMPKSTGDYLADVDVKLYDLACCALIDLPIKLWSFLLLNRTDYKSNNGDNFNNCKDLLESVKDKHIEVEKCVIANCASVGETHLLLDTILDYLTNNINHLDCQYAKVCQERILEIHKAVEAELSKAKVVFAQEASEEDYQEIEELFSELFGDSNKGWWKEVALGLQELRAQLWYQRQVPNEELHDGVIAALEKCEQEKGILSSENALQEINTRIMIDSAFRAYPDYQDELRVLISHRFLALDENLKQTVESIKNQVVSILKEKGHLDCISESECSEFFNVISTYIPERLIKLKTGFKIIADFHLSYRGLILPRIRQHLDGLTNVSAMAGQAGSISEQHDKTITVSKDTTAEDILTALEIDYDKAVNTIKPALEELLSEPNEAVYAMVEEFIDNVIRQKDIQKEWRIFLRGIRGKIWAEEFGKKEQDRYMRKEWIELINQVDLVNQFESFRFI